jgi:hypothetical protein
VRQLPEGGGRDAVLPLGNGADYHDVYYPFYPSPRAALGSGASSAWFLGEAIDPEAASLLFVTPAAAAAVIRFGKVTASGATSWGPDVAVAPGLLQVTGTLPAGPATGIVAQVVSGAVPAHQATITVDGRTFEVDGSLSSAIQPDSWRQVGVADGLTLFVRRRAPMPIFALTDNKASPLHVTVLSSTTKYETIKVHVASPSTIVRDVAWDPGWRATVSVNGGPARRVAVVDQGLVQQVRIPGGTDVVTFRYLPPHIEVASALTVGGVVFLVVLGLVRFVQWWPRRRAVGPTQQ